MNTSMLGADPQQLRALARDFSSAATELTQLSTALTQRINRPGAWQGNDAESFRQRWNSSSRSVLDSASKTIQSAASCLIRNADEQDKTSGEASLGSGSGAGAGGTGGSSVPASNNGSESGANSGSTEKADSRFESFEHGFDTFTDWKTALLDAPGWASTFLKGADFLRDFDSTLGWNSSGQLWKLLPASGMKSWGEALAGDNWSALGKGAASFLNDKAFFAGLNDSKFAGVLSGAGETLSGASKALGVAGKALGPLGSVIGVATTINDFAKGDTGRGVYDGVMTGLGTAALLTPPPADLILGGGALVMGLGELAYDKIPGFKGVVDGGIGAVEDTAKNVTKSVEHGWDNVTHGKWPWG